MLSNQPNKSNPYFLKADIEDANKALKSLTSKSLLSSLSESLFKNPKLAEEVLAEQVSRLLALRKKIRLEINTRANILYNRLNPQLTPTEQSVANTVKYLMETYLLLQEGFKLAAQVYLKLDKKHQIHYWELMEIKNPDAVRSEFKDLLKISNLKNLTDKNKEKVYSFLFQDFHSEKCRTLFSSIVFNAKKLNIPLIFSDQLKRDRDEVIPLVYGKNEIEQNANKDLLFSKYKPVSDNNNVTNASSPYFNYAVDISPGDPTQLKGLQICITNKDYLSFVHTYNEHGRLACCFLDFAQLNLHEFGHVLAYMTGEILDPSVDCSPLQPELLTAYSNAEEFRNIFLSPFSENNLDDEGPQRVGHKSVLICAFEEFLPFRLHRARDFYGMFIEESVLLNKDFQFMLIKNEGVKQAEGKLKNNPNT